MLQDLSIREKLDLRNISVIRYNLQLSFPILLRSPLPRSDALLLFVFLLQTVQLYVFLCICILQLRWQNKLPSPSVSAPFVYCETRPSVREITARCVRPSSESYPAQPNSSIRPSSTRPATIVTTCLRRSAAFSARSATQTLCSIWA